MESVLDYHTARALLDWQVELGATEAILDAPVNRYEIPETIKKVQAAEPVAVARKPSVDPVKIAQTAAKACADLTALKAAIAEFEHCPIKRGARSLVFGDGHPNARVMIISETPDRDEDRIGKPFVGRPGQLLDKMLSAIEMDRSAENPQQAVYTSNILPWRLPQSREPSPEDFKMMRPFVQRHVELIDPDVIVLMGNTACQGVLGKRGITRLRGEWAEAFGKPILPMFHPSYLMKNPNMKREAWADLLALKAKLLPLS